MDTKLDNTVSSLNEQEKQTLRELLDRDLKSNRGNGSDRPTRNFGWARGKIRIASESVGQASRLPADKRKLVQRYNLGVKLLLDTHALLWFSNGDSRLSELAKASITDPENDLLLSRESVWEMAIKVSVGKLDLSRSTGIFLPIEQEATEETEKEDLC